MPDPTETVVEPTATEVTEQVAEPTTPTTPATEKPVEPTEDYAKRYKGLQRTYQALFAKHEKLESDYDEVMQQLETIRAGTGTKDSEISNLTKQMNDLKAENERLSNQVSDFERKDVRIKVLLNKFPHLAGFEARGLLPGSDANDEETLEKIFTDFSSALDSTVTSRVGEEIKGIGNARTTVTTEPQLSKSEVYTRLTQLAGKNDPESKAEYLKYRKIWDSFHVDEEK